MSVQSFILHSLRHYWRGHLGLLLGSFLASAILSGSLVIGDSVRASLRRVAALRLGKVQGGLIGGDRWFTEALAGKVGAAPMIQMQGSASKADGSARANSIQVLGVENRFWSLSPGGRTIAIGDGELAVNEPLARKLNVKAGDTVIVRVEKPSAISRDAPLSGSTNEQVTLRRRIAAIVSAHDFGAFQLTASQRPPDSVYLSLADVQGQVEKEGRVNAMIEGSHTTALDARLRAAATLEDFSLKLIRLPGPKPGWEINTDRVFVDESIATRLLQRPGAYGVLTYLVNGITSAKGRTPYSMVTAVNLPATASPESAFRTPSSALITQWLADDQKLAIGDSIELRYFVVGLGRELKEEKAAFTVGEIIPMTDSRVSRSWTPEFPGVSDVDNCRDWEPGIPMDMKAIRDQDEKYWDDYKGTPKAFISLAAGQNLWSNRFGSHTAIRFADTGRSEDQVRSEIVSDLSLADIGLTARDFGTEAAAAAKGSVDFGGLFIGLSMFLIAAALIFASLLFVFTLERRASQVGLLLAMGWGTGRVRRWILGEAGLVALGGSALGLLGGVAYTKAALAGLGGVWSGAAPGLELVYAAGPSTLAIAFVASFGISALTLWLASRRLFKIPARALLAGEVLEGRAPSSGHSRARGARSWIVAVVALIAAIALAVAAGRARDAQALAGMFFGAGALVMIAGLALAAHWMRRGASRERLADSVWQVGARNVARRPSRSLAVLGMMAGGIFLVMAVNAFRMGVSSDVAPRDSGTGGFALIGESSLPIYEDLNTAAAIDAFGLDEGIMKQTRIVSFRVREGDDASCLNLNRAQNPVLVAVNARELAERKAFRFADGEGWAALAGTDNGGTEPVPAIADQATAMWGLGKGIGDTLEYRDGRGAPFRVKIIGLLAGSVLQGKMIIDETAFIRKFPDTAGYKFFLIDASADRAAAVNGELTRQLETRGLALEQVSARLAEFNSVQNTYIGIFTVLGGLGVLLGTAGLGVLLARHVLERRGELGLMQALGFEQGALRSMIVGEHATLLIGGVLLGLLSAALAVWPSLKQGGGDLPFGFLGALLAAIVVFGFIVCALAAVVAVRGRLIEAIRRE